MGGAPYCKFNIDCDQFLECKGQEKHINISFQNENLKSENLTNNNIFSNKETAIYDSSCKNIRFNNCFEELKSISKHSFLPLRNMNQNILSVNREDFVLSSGNFNSTDKKKSYSETFETKNKVSQEIDIYSKTNYKYVEAEENNEKNDIKQSNRMKINPDEKENILKFSKFNEHNSSKIEIESKFELSKIEHHNEDNNSNMSIGFKSKKEELEEFPRDKPIPIEKKESKHDNCKIVEFSKAQDIKKTNDIITQRINSFEIDPELKLRGSVLSNDSKQSKQNKINLSSRRENQDDKKKQLTISYDKNDQTWRKMKITNFIPHEKLIESNEDDLIFHSELSTVTLPDSKNQTVKPFSLKFCVLTKNQLKHYKSKEAYFRLVEPSLVLQLNNIISCDTINIDQSIFKKDKTLKYFFFYVKYLFNEDKIELKTITSQGSGTEATKFNSRIVNLIEENKRIKGKKINLLHDSKPTIRKMSNNEDNLDFKNKIRDTNFDFNNSLVFASINKNLIDKWVCSINHFIKK